MKKTFTVNLGNMVFSIDDDAYLVLKDYLDSIEEYFSADKDKEDIMNDIEGRISEILSSLTNPGKQVINIKDIDHVISIMGDPLEIGGSEKKAQTSYRSEYRSRPGRLYRDPDDRVIGGVCSGLGAYFDIDPLIIRIIFIILFFVFFGFIIYLVLWIAVPEARTTSQKIEMRGDPVNVSNIGKFVKDEYESVKRSFRGKKKNN
ncbi:MAG: PspC domain-containing protein [Actinobacteria bacterium]|nr:PspC domain-containing protein [Actinomycetota bacterium]